jgi:hypothetical protein
VARHRLTGAAALLFIILLTLTAWSALGAKFASAAAGGPPRPGVAVLFVVDRVSFEELMSVPEFRQLSRAGGAGLMTTKAGTGDPIRAAYLTITAGALAPDGGTPFLVDTALVANGVTPCLAGGGPTLPDGGPLQLLTGSPRPEDCPVARSDGGLIRVSGDPIDHLMVFSDGETFRLQERRPLVSERTAREIRHSALLDEGSQLQQLLSLLQSAPTLVMVVTPSPSSAMDRVGDEVTPLVLAEGPADHLLLPEGAMHGLTSGTTRQDGLVSNVDVAPTLLRFFGVAVPAEMDGQPITVTDGDAPFGLHRLHLEQRRIRLPLQLAEVSFAAAAFFVSVALLVALAVRGRIPPRLAAGSRFAPLAGVALIIALLAGGLLPRLTYPVVVPFILVVTAGLAALAARARGPSTIGPFVFLGKVGLALLVVDATLGGRAFRVPLMGGTMFDGVRYYGLPNSFTALLMASALFVAVAMRPYPGFVLLFAAGLFAGFPRLGADIGGAVTLFAAAGMWWVVRSRAHIRVLEVVEGAGIVIIGLGLVLLANRYLPGTPTHATRFVERTGGHFGGAVSELRHRLGVGVGQLNDVPVAYIPIVGLAVVAALVARGAGPIGRALDALPAWRDLIVIMAVASLVAFAANDTGVAAAAPGFLYVVAALVYPVLAMAQAEAERVA